MMTTDCIDLSARVCLLRYLYAMRHGRTDKPCYRCEPAAKVVAVMRGEEAAPAASIPAAPSARGSLLRPASVPPVATQKVPKPSAASCQDRFRDVSPYGLDLVALREVLRDLLKRQGKTGQKSVFLERLQSLCNAAARKGAKLRGKRDFREALQAVPNLSLQGAYLLLDNGAWAFCAEEGEAS
jgi:hypothetical protein